MKKTGIVIGVLAAICAFAWAQTEDSTTQAPGGVYIVTYRAPAHVRNSSPEVFHSASADIRKALAEKGVPIVPDSERGFIENESRMSVESMTTLAGESGAGSLLFVTVDRPMTKWIKLVLQLYSLDGKKLWEEKVDSGMSSMSGDSGYRKCLEKLNQVLAKRIGTPGLPVSIEMPGLEESR